MSYLIIEKISLIGDKCFMLKVESKKRKDEESLNDETILVKYSKLVEKIRPLTQEEEIKYAQLSEKGCMESRRKLINGNLKLVLNIAKKLLYTSNIPLIDLIQEGNLGLMIAVEKYNWKLGYKFSTYASFWVKQSMYKLISEQSRCFKVPVYIQETLSKYSKLKSKLEQKYSCTLTVEDIASKMNIDPAKINNYIKAFSKSISIDEEYNFNNGSKAALSDILEDKKIKDFKEIELKYLRKDLNYVLSQLKEREYQVISMRYGLRDGAQKTLEQIGKIYGVTKECIRQTEKRAIKKIRENTYSYSLLESYI